MNLRWATCVVLALFGPASVLSAHPGGNKKDRAEGAGTIPVSGTPVVEEAAQTCKRGWFGGFGKKKMQLDHLVHCGKHGDA